MKLLKTSDELKKAISEDNNYNYIIVEESEVHKYKKKIDIYLSIFFCFLLDKIDELI